MPIFRQSDVVKFTASDTDGQTRQWRPALVGSTGAIEDLHGLLWVAMITSAENRGWPGDADANDLALVGLPVPSVVRSAKIATIDAADAIRLGRVSATRLRQDRSAVVGLGRITRDDALRVPQLRQSRNRGHRPSFLGPHGGRRQGRVAKKTAPGCGAE